MDDLYGFFLQDRKQRPIHKWHHYFEVYQRHLERFRAACPVVLEIGIEHGGSLEMWRRFFGPHCRLYGLDINPSTIRHEDVATRVYIGDQQDRELLRTILREAGPFDVVIDDGGHTAAQQIASFEELYPTLAEQGVYIVEDTHTALWGGPFADLPDGRTFLQFAFARCLQLMEWTGKRDNFALLGTDENIRLAGSVSEFCRATKAVSFFDSMVVFERGRRAVPRHERRGPAPLPAPAAAAVSGPRPATTVPTEPGLQALRRTLPAIAPTADPTPRPADLGVAAPATEPMPAPTFEMLDPQDDA